MRSLGSALGHSMGSFPGYSGKFSSFMPQKRRILCYSLVSSLLWRHPTSSATLGFLPVYGLCHPTPRLGGPLRISRVPDSALMTCHGLGPRWARESPGD